MPSQKLGGMRHPQGDMRPQGRNPKGTPGKNPKGILSKGGISGANSPLLESAISTNASSFFRSGSKPLHSMSSAYNSTDSSFFPSIGGSPESPEGKAWTPQQGDSRRIHRQSDSQLEAKIRFSPDVGDHIRRSSSSTERWHHEYGRDVDSNVDSHDFLEVNNQYSPMMSSTDGFLQIKKQKLAKEEWNHGISGGKRAGLGRSIDFWASHGPITPTPSVLTKLRAEIELGKNRSKKKKNRMSWDEKENKEGEGKGEEMDVWSDPTTLRRFRDAQHEMQATSHGINNTLDTLITELMDYSGIQRNRKQSPENDKDAASSSSKKKPLAGQRRKSVTMINPDEYLRATGNEDRDLVRKALIDAVGNAWEAFRYLDAMGNNTNTVSVTDLAGCMDRFKIDWKELLEIRNKEDLVLFFDRSKSGSIHLSQLFPQESDLVARTRRTSTPDFWKTWCRKNRNFNIESGNRSPRWARATSEQKVDALMEAKVYWDKAYESKRNMKHCITSLRLAGKSDSVIRAVVCPHLRRATGPYEAGGEGRMFWDADVKSAKRSYREENKKPLKHIERCVFDLRNSRRQLHTTRIALYGVTEKPLKAKECENKNNSLLSRYISTGLTTENEGIIDFEAEALEMNVSKESLMALHEEFKKYDKDGSGGIDRSELGPMLSDLLRIYRSEDDINLTEQTLNRHWKQIRGIGSTKDGKLGSGFDIFAALDRLGQPASFHQFAIWFNKFIADFS